MSSVLGPNNDLRLSVLVTVCSSSPLTFSTSSSRGAASTGVISGTADVLIVSLVPLGDGMTGAVALIGSVVLASLAGTSGACSDVGDFLAVNFETRFVK